MNGMPTHETHSEFSKFHCIQVPSISLSKHFFFSFSLSIPTIHIINLDFGLLRCPCYQWSNVVFGLFVDSLMLSFLLMKTNIFSNCLKKKRLFRSTYYRQWKRQLNPNFLAWLIRPLITWSMVSHPSFFLASLNCSTPLLQLHDSLLPRAYVFFSVPCVCTS